ncbi:MAG: virulence RhuM family protein, partial [Bacteroidales bacterium]|nr:virulence RhuM family protein [Bacteroidales bacterium]
MKNEIVIYQPEEVSIRIDVRIEDETVWLNKEQIALLFGRDRSVISRHINNIFKEGELKKEEVCAFFAHTTQHGAIKGKSQTKQIEYYNLDVIISVGYRVKSKQGTQFRIWANKILKDYLLKGYALNNRMNRIEDNVHKLSQKVKEIDLQLKTNLPPNQGIFYNGQVFDAYMLIADIIRSAKKEIVLIDNYPDDTVLKQLAKRKNSVKAIIYSKTNNKIFKQDLQKHNEQYPKIELKKLTTAHDRFLIIDNKTVYHFGASLKD